MEDVSKGVTAPKRSTKNCSELFSEKLMCFYVDKYDTGLLTNAKLFY